MCKHVHIFVTKWCIAWYRIGVLWDIGPKHRRICELAQLVTNDNWVILHHTELLHVHPITFARARGSDFKSKGDKLLSSDVANSGVSGIQYPVHWMLAPKPTKPLSRIKIEILSIGTWGTNFNENLSEIRKFSFKKMHLKMSSGNWRPFCLCLGMLTICLPLARPGFETSRLRKRVSSLVFHGSAYIIRFRETLNPNYSDVIMSAMASQITGVLIVCSTVCSGAAQRKHQSHASLAFLRGIHRSPVDSPHKESVTRKIFPFDDVILQHTQKCSSTLLY